MSRFIESASVTVRTRIVLEENELAALEALAGYGVDQFLEVFYEHMGRAYIEKHEAGLRSLFASITQESGLILKRANEARQIFGTPRGIPQEKTT